MKNIIKKIFGKILDEFEVPGNSGEFVFSLNDSLIKVCNIPDGKSCGVYIFTMGQGDKEVPVYIGCSGLVKEGELQPRKTGVGGMKDRICNGNQISKTKSKKSKRRAPFFKDEMKKKGINQLKVYWFITNNLKCPEYIEYRLILQHISRYHELPEYNNKLVRREP